MKTAIIKSYNHLYKIFRVYLTMVVLGVLLAIGIQSVIARPLLAVPFLLIVVNALAAYVITVVMKNQPPGERHSEKGRNSSESRSFATGWYHVFDRYRSVESKKEFRKKI
jgi:hypothetical protein